MFSKNINELNRQCWLEKTLTSLPSGSRILDAILFKLRGKKRAEDLACFGWQCVALKNKQTL